MHHTRYYSVNSTRRSQNHKRQKERIIFFHAFV
jgi:hypothetical protein